MYEPQGADSGSKALKPRKAIVFVMEVVYRVGPCQGYHFTYRTCGPQLPIFCLTISRKHFSLGRSHGRLDLAPLIDSFIVGVRGWVVCAGAKKTCKLKDQHVALIGIGFGLCRPLCNNPTNMTKTCVKSVMRHAYALGMTFANLDGSPPDCGSSACGAKRSAKDLPHQF